MENVALQCRKLVEEAARESWTTDQSDALKEQVVSLAKEDHPVRKIASKSHVAGDHPTQSMVHFRLVASPLLPLVLEGFPHSSNVLLAPPLPHGIPHALVYSFSTFHELMAHSTHVKGAMLLLDVCSSVSVRVLGSPTKALFFREMYFQIPPQS